MQPFSFGHHSAGLCVHHLQLPGKHLKCSDAPMYTSLQESRDVASIAQLGAEVIFFTTELATHQARYHASST